MYFANNQFLTDFADTYVERGLSLGGKGKKRLALTFDDGPGEQTAALLSIFERFEVKASFFLLAQHIETRAPLVKQMISAGHTVGMHGLTHESVATLSAEQFEQQQLLPLQQCFERHLQCSSCWYRPPFGEINPAIMALLKSGQTKVVGWSIDPMDWENSAKSDHVDSVVSTVMQQAHDGGIVLLHDGDESCDGANKIVEIVTRLVPKLLAAGFDLVSIEQMVAHGVGPSILADDNELV
jgi:peptidoglycan/xylan/chitin deacetylase (PgdA/CDA1 family)